MTLPSDKERADEVRKLLEELEKDEDFLADRVERAVLGSRSSLVNDFIKLLEGRDQFPQIYDGTQPPQEESPK